MKITNFSFVSWSAVTFPRIPVSALIDSLSLVHTKFSSTIFFAKGDVLMKSDNCDIANLSPEQLKAIKDFESDFTSKFGSPVYVIAYQSH